MRYLIVDDNEDNLKFLGLILRNEGHHVTQARNGREALEAARGLLPDVAVSDILMPEMDGFMLCRVWQEDPALRGIPFVFFTATYTTQEDETFALSLGARAFLRKPADPVTFLASMEEILKDLPSKPPPAAPKRLEHEDFLALYSQRLVEKLEHRSASLAASEERYRKLFECMRDAIFLADPRTGILLDANSAACNLVGRSREELVGQALEALHPPEEASTYREVFRQQAASGGSRFLTGLTVQHQDGRRIPVEVSASTFETSEGPAMIGVYRDVTERARAEEALRESEERFRTLVSQSPDGIFLADLEGRLLSVNEEMCRRLGYSEAELLSMNIWDLLPARFRSQQEHRMVSILKGEQLDEAAEYEVRTKDGSLRLIDVRSAPYKIGGKIVAFHGIARDITDRRRAEEDLRKAQEQLAEARNLQTIGMIAGGVAHEVRNPLFALTTIAAALEQKLADRPELEEYTGHITEQTKRLNELMNDLLALGRPIPEEQFRPCLLREVLSQAIARIEKSDPGACRRCVMTCSEEAFAVQGIAEKLEQVFFNLVHNALALSPREAPLEIRIWREGSSVCLSVSDRGPGIPPEFLPRLFQPFATKRKGGTGLGLAIVQKIVSAHGGTISGANNDPPPGATFTVWLPLALEETVEGP
jgi:two-component system cell cycle sensor histidine kinase/response regulator CckA